MPDGEHPIDSYLTQLGRRLHLPAAERDQVLAEVRGHLKERAGALQEMGVSQEQAERQAVLAFGPVGRISREMRTSHPISWGKWRWLVGMVIGAVVTWAVYLAGTVPFLIYYLSAHHLPMPQWIPLLLWNWSRGSMVGYAWLTPGYTVGWLWVLPFLVLYPVLPFRWGGRAQHWWVPGLAYGLGTGLWIVFVLVNSEVGSPDWIDWIATLNMNPFAWIMAVSLTLALAASFVGWWWRERSASALARAQAA